MPLLLQTALLVIPVTVLLSATKDAVEQMVGKVAAVSVGCLWMYNTNVLVTAIQLPLLVEVSVKGTVPFRMSEVPG